MQDERCNELIRLLEERHAAEMAAVLDRGNRLITEVRDVRRMFALAVLAAGGSIRISRVTIDALEHHEIRTHEDLRTGDYIYAVVNPERKDA